MSKSCFFGYYTGEENVGKILKIETKTGTITDSQTNDLIEMTISCSKCMHICATNKLDNPGSVDQFTNGQIDTFSGSMLGQCEEKLFGPSSNGIKITLKTNGHDAWLMEWVKIYFVSSNGNITTSSNWICNNTHNKWLDVEDQQYSLDCEGKYIFTPPKFRIYV